MSLRRDFKLYYEGSYVGFRSDSGEVLPFYVYEVLGGGDTYDKESEDSLIFSGRLFKSSSKTKDIQVSLGSGLLVLSLPELGYVKHGDHCYWLSYRPVRAAQKGLSSNKVVGARLTGQLVLDIYKAAHEEPCSLRRQFFVRDGQIYYKGRFVGTILDGVESFLDVFSYVKDYYNKAFPRSA